MVAATEMDGESIVDIKVRHNCNDKKRDLEI